MAEPLADHPYRSLPTAELGRLEREFRGAQGPASDSGQRALVALIMGGAGVAALYFGSLLAGFAVMCALIGLTVARYWLAGRRVSARLYAGGVALVVGRRTQTVLWNEIVSFWRDETVELMGKKTVGESRNYSLQTASGASLHFDDSTAGSRELADRIQNEVVERQLPAARESIAAGSPVPFGNLVVHPLGLASHGQAPVEWQRIERVLLFEGALHVRRHGEQRFWIRVPVREIPNVAVLWRLLAELAPAAIGSDPVGGILSSLSSTMAEIERLFGGVKGNQPKS